MVMEIGPASGSPGTMSTSLAYCASGLRCMNYIPDDDEEAGKEISFTSIITHLKTIWLVQEDDFQTWPIDIEEFDPFTFGLEEKTEESKTLIEQCCQISMLRSSSMQMKCNSSTNCGIVLDFVDDIIKKIIVHKNMYNILIEIQAFMRHSLVRVDKCTDSNELDEYINFVHAFSCDVACFLCLLWLKEDNEEEITTDMNILLFDMLNEIKPYAANVSNSYFTVLKPNYWQTKEWEDTPARFVDFFFEHTILEDVFLILIVRLIHLFTFLADAPAQEYVIRTQIYALFHEDAYLLLPINEMKEDLSNNMMLLSDCVIKIDILTAKIIQFNRGPSDSWNTLEAWNMNNIYFASLEKESFYNENISFLRLFFQCFETWDDSDEETMVQFRSMVTSLQRIWGREYGMGLLSFKRDIADLELLEDLALKEKVQMSKQEIKAWLLSSSHCSYHCRTSTSNKILKFLDLTSDFKRYHILCKDVAFMKQNEILEEKLVLLKNLLKLTTNCAYSKNLEEFFMLAQVLANNAACLICLYWAKEADDDIPAETNLMLSSMLQKIKPDTPNVAKTYIGTFKAICLQPYDSLLFEQTVMSFFDCFFQDLTTHWKNDFQILRDDVMFFLTFVHHHRPPGNMVEIICSQLDVLFNDGAYDLLPFDDINGDLSKKKVGLTDFMLNIGTENGKIRQLYCKFPDSFVSKFPRMISQGFLDCTIQKLGRLTERMISDQKYEPFAESLEGIVISDSYI